MVQASQIKVKITSTMEKTLRCISSLLNFDTFSTKRKKLLHQSLQNTSCMRIIKHKETRKVLYHSSGISRKRGDRAPSTGITHKEKEGPQPCYLLQVQTERTLFKSMSREKCIQTTVNKDD
jgi:hypothetical protein